MRGHVAADDAQLFVRTRLLLGAALTAETARWAGGWADGLITVARSRRVLRDVVEAFRDGGGDGKPTFLQVALSHASSDAEAARTAHDQWRHCTLTPQQLADLATPAAFDRACEHASVQDVEAVVRVSADPGQHLDWLEQAAQLGFDRLYLHNVARAHQDAFIEMCATRLIPSLVAAGS
jgi:coenzyme F420-dependent glucose-6-phosphate dehydrogenase